MVYMDEWEYHKMLELQSERAKLESAQTASEEVNLETGLESSPTIVVICLVLEAVL